MKCIIKFFLVRNLLKQSFKDQSHIKDYVSHTPIQFLLYVMKINQGLQQQLEFKKSSNYQL